MHWPLWTPALGFTIASFIYANSLDAEWTFDDHAAVVGNPDVMVRGDATTVAQLWRNDFWGTPLRVATSHQSYRPLTTLSFRANALLGGREAGRHWHVVNVAAHALACALYAAALRCIVFGARRPMATLVATLAFAVHPVHVEAVASIVGRADVLAGVCFLLALLAHHAAQQRMNSTAMAFAYTAATVALTLAAMLCKETGVTALAVCVALELERAVSTWAGCRRRRNVNRVMEKRRPCPCPSITRALALSLAFATLCVLRLAMSGGHPPLFSAAQNPAAFAPDRATRLMSRAHIWVLTARQLFAPAYLCADWSMGGVPLVTTWRDPRNILSVACAVVLCATLACVLAPLGLRCREESTAAPKKVEKTALRATVETTAAASKQDDEKVAEKEKESKISLGCAAAAAEARATNGGSAQAWSQLDAARACAVALALLAIPFLPSANIFVDVGFVVAERVLYIPSMGACALLPLLADVLASNAAAIVRQACKQATGGRTAKGSSSGQRRGSRSERGKERGEKRRPRSAALYAHRAVWYIIVAGFLVRSAVLTWRRNPEWRSDETLARSGAAAMPTNAKLHYNLAVCLTRPPPSDWPKVSSPGESSGEDGLAKIVRMRHAKALLAFETALAAQPDYAGAYLGVSGLYEDAGRVDEAEAALRNAIVYDDVWSHDGSLDVHGRAHLSLGVLIMRHARGEIVLSELHAAEVQGVAFLSRADVRARWDPMVLLRSAVRILPTLPAAHSALGVLLDERKRGAEAISHHLRAVQLIVEQEHDLPGVPRGMSGLSGSSEEEAGGSGGTYSASAQARYNLALCQHRLGHIEAALEAYRRALEDSPQSADAHAGVGVALWQLGQPVEAAAELRRALVLKPAHEQARVNLDRLLTSGDAV